MSGDMSLRPKQVPTAVYLVGWILLVGVGALLVWYGFRPTGGGEPTVEPTAVLPVTPLGTAGPTALPPSPTNTPMPTATLPPTPIPPTATPGTPYIVAGELGVNVRTGSGINYQLIGHLDPGAQAQVTGQHNGWWQILYQGGPGWVIDEYVTAYNTGSIPDVQPPPAPTAVPPTPVPPTPVPQPTVPPTPTTNPVAYFRGLKPNSYVVEGAPGPYGAGQDIWFNMDITNESGGNVDYTALGTWVEETGQYQKSWTNSTFSPGQHFTWRDHINIPTAGTYHLYMRICYTDGWCVNMLGPVVANVQ